MAQRRLADPGAPVQEDPGRQGVTRRKHNVDAVELRAASDERLHGGRSIVAGQAPHVNETVTRESR